MKTGGFSSKNEYNIYYYYIYLFFAFLFFAVDIRFDFSYIMGEVGQLFLTFIFLVVISFSSFTLRIVDWPPGFLLTLFPGFVILIGEALNKHFSQVTRQHLPPTFSLRAVGFFYIRLLVPACGFLFVNYLLRYPGIM